MRTCWLLSLLVACGGEQATEHGPGTGGGGTGGNAGAAGAGGSAGSPVPSFKKLQLSSVFYAEGATFGDLDGDGDNDVVAGPHWYEGPSFQQKHEIYPPMAFDPKGYSNNFFAFLWDFNQDTFPDLLVVGFPGKDASWYENPQGGPGSWTRHLAVPVVDNESPAFVDLTGDGIPELVHAANGHYGWSTPNSDANAEWTFHALSTTIEVFPFTHGLGVGDINGDGRSDLLTNTGFWEQPPTLAGDPAWGFQPYVFGEGGAQMFARDVDADGDADLITSLQAHGYGISWFERTASTKLEYVPHVISSDLQAATSLHEPHALAMADINGDGLEDIVTGERFWGHVPGGDPDFDAPAKLVWFEAGSNSFVPHLIDDHSGVGTQVVAGDIDADGKPDIVIANKKGVFVFLQQDP